MRAIHSPTPRRTLLLAGLLGAGLLAGCTRKGGDGNVQPPDGGGPAGSLALASVGLGGAGADGASRRASISADGNLVAFESTATNLVAGDTNSATDVFVRNRSAGTTTRVSVSSSGQEAGGSSGRPAISGNGRFVAFQSDAPDLVGDDTNAVRDIFVHDRQSGETTRVSISSLGEEADGPSSDPAISADGRFVAFQSEATNLVADDTNGDLDIFVHDRVSQSTVRVSVDSNGVQGDGDSTLPSLSADGLLVAFISAATNLVADDTNGALDVFVHDLVAQTTERVSVDSSGAEADGDSGLAAISGEGRFVAFVSEANDLVAADTNGARDVFVHDRQTGATSRVSVSSQGTQASGASPPAGAAARPSISANGRFVAFTSAAANLVASDTNGAPDVFRHDRTTGQTRRINLTVQGFQSAGDPIEQVTTAVSSDGTRIAFHSADDGLLQQDANGEVDVFVRTEPASAALGAPAGSFEPAGAVRLSVSGLDLARGAAAPAPVERTFCAPQGSPWRAHLEPPAPWLSLSAWTGPGSGGDDDRIELELLPGGLAPGVYRTHLRLTPLDGPELLAELLVELHVRD